MILPRSRGTMIYSAGPREMINDAHTHTTAGDDQDFSALVEDDDNVYMSVSDFAAIAGQ